MRFAIALFFLLAACGRPLTPNELAFTRALQGPELDTQKVRVLKGLPGSSITFKRPIRPRLTCQERLFPPSEGETVTTSPIALVLFNTIRLRKDIWREDFLPAWPEKIDLLDAMLLAHEMTHVWQWQNRDLTGYHPIKAAREHRVSADPYLIDPTTQSRFLDHGYEQQGAIVEEYVCCRVLDPDAPRTDRLRRMIGEVMPVDRLDAMIDRPAVRLPWRGVEIEGICR